MSATRVRGSIVNGIWGLALACGLMTACGPASDSSVESAPAAESLDPVDTAPEGAPAEAYEIPVESDMEPMPEEDMDVIEDEGLSLEGEETEEPIDPEAETPED